MAADTRTGGLFVPPFPRPLRRKTSPLMRLVRGWSSSLHTLYEKSYGMKLGEVRMPGIRSYIANEPALIRDIMVSGYRGYPKHRLQHRILHPVMGDSIFTANGPVWERQRRMMDPAFAVTRIGRIFHLMRDGVDELMRRLEAAPRDRPLVIDPEMMHVAADIIFRTILSAPLDRADAAVIYRAFEAYQLSANREMLLSSFALPTRWYRRRSQRAAGRIRRIIARYIAQRYAARAQGAAATHHDILAALMDAVDPETGATIGEAEALDHVCMLFLAGHETSASALSWACYLLAACPGIQESAAAEVAAVTGGEPLRVEQVKSLVQVHDVFRETLRLYPPVPFFMREAAEAHELRGKPVAVGDAVLVSPWLSHRNPTLWRDPHAFDPSRFRDGSCERAIKVGYFPFGMGPRTCIGSGFATQEGVLVLATMLQRFRLEVAPGHVPEVSGRITVRPKRGVRLLLRDRTAP